MEKNGIILSENYFLLRFKNKVNVPNIPYMEARNKTYVATMMYGLTNLGYTFSEELFDRLSALSMEDIDIVFADIYENLKEMVGANDVHNAMYPNFPDQVMQASELELYLIAMLHYWTNGQWKPNYKQLERAGLPLKKHEDLKVIDIGGWKDLIALYTNILNSKSSIGNLQVDFFNWFWETMNPGMGIHVGKIYMKEILALYAKNMFQYCEPYQWRVGFVDSITNVNDILRIAVALSDGDVSLSNVRFKSFSRKERRFLLTILDLFVEKSKGTLEDIGGDMLPYLNEWILLGERIHPFERRHAQYNNAVNMFYLIRNQANTLQTFESRVQTLLQEGDMEVINLLKTRPTVFARKLDHLLRWFPHQEINILIEFDKIATQVSVPVLLQMWTHFKNRDLEYRVFMPKSDMGKIYGMENNLPKIKDSVISTVLSMVNRALLENFKDYGDLGKVFIEEELEYYAIPMQQRSQNDSLMGISRGSRLPIPDDGGDYFRFFLHWVNYEYRTDLDLSLVFYTADFEHVKHISYTNLKSSHPHAVHSGDLVDAPEEKGGATEFIDFSRSQAEQLNIRYVVPTIYSFTQRPFQELPSCYVGWMNVREPMAGQIFEPSLVANKIDIASDAKFYVPVVIDLYDDEIIFADLAVKDSSSLINNVESTKNIGMWMLKSVATMVRPTLGHLFRLHAQARGEEVYEKEEADIIFGITEGDVTTKDIDIILSEYL